MVKRRKASQSESEAKAKRKARTREKIISAARDIILQEGFAASLETIAASAGVGRTTLFNQFESKDRLFQAVIEETSQSLLSSMAEVPSDLPLRDALLRFGRNYVSMALNPYVIGLSRLAMAAPNRIPGLAKFNYRIGFSRTVPVLAAYLKKRMECGELAECDPQEAAERFFAAAIGHSRHRILFDMPGDSVARIDAFIVETVDLFVRGMSSPTNVVHARESFRKPAVERLSRRKIARS